MLIIKFILVIANLFLLAFLGAIVIPTAKHADLHLAIVIAAGLALNLFYILVSPLPGTKPTVSRITRLVSLWLDAKENELRDRAKTKQ